MWAAHDDRWRSDFITRTVAVLRSDDAAICCQCSQAQPIDSRGEAVGEPYVGFVNEEASGSPARWRRMLSHWELRAAIYGLMRRSVVRKTRLLQPAVSADLVFMAEMALHGTIRQVADVLAWKRVPDVGSAYRTPAEIMEFLTAPQEKVRRAPRFHRLHVTFECLRGLRHARGWRPTANVSWRSIRSRAMSAPGIGRST